MYETSSANTTASGLYVNADDKVKEIVLLIYYVLIILVGVPGNCLILRVYWGKSHKCSTHILIMGLAAADLTICLLRLWDVISLSSELAGAGIPDLSDRFNCFDYTIVGTSIMITGVIAVDRYDCVCRPNRRVMTHGRTLKALLAALATSVAVHIPKYVKVAMGDEAPDFLGKLLYVLQIASFVIPIVMISVCYSCVFLTIRKHVRVGALSSRNLHKMNFQTDWSTKPQASLIIATASTPSLRLVGSVSNQPPSNVSPNPDNNKEWNAGKTIHVEAIPKLTPSAETIIVKKGPLEPRNPPGVSAKLRMDIGATTSTKPPRLPAHKRRQASAPALQRRTTMMLFGTSVVFVLSWLPYWIKALLEIFGVTSAFLDAFMEVLYLNNAVNPFIYGLANRRFRKDCRDVFRKLRQC